ncbi:MAG: hypothetical protein VYB98_07245, partial [Actinomycetota bacterium]|nr:hypothetical protein [Actinomycetota bacterium]
MESTPPCAPRRAANFSSLAALTPLMVLLPFSLISLRLIWIPLNAVLNLFGISVTFWLLPIVWVAAAGVLFVRFAQTLL